MNRSLPLAMAFSLAIASAAFSGCESNREMAPTDSDSGFAGGNGAFGESPLQPGAYPADSQQDGSARTPPANPVGD